MKKYWTIIKTEFQRQLTYRLDFFGFRFGNLIEIFSQLIVWRIIFNTTSQVGDYNLEEMTTYVIVGWLFLFLTASYGFEDNVAKDIKLGSLSNFMLKPISYLRYMSILSLGRVSIALATGIFLQAMVIFLFHNYILPPSSLFAVIIIIFMVVLGYLINLFISILIGFIAFWTLEINGIFRGILFLKRFLSGTYFPINLLPVLFLHISLAFPFAYTFFVPTQLYLGKMTILQGLIGLGIEILWLFILYGIIKVVWWRGLKKYEGVGI